MWIEEYVEESKRIFLTTTLHKRWNFGNYGIEYVFIMGSTDFRIPFLFHYFLI